MTLTKTKKRKKATRYHGRKMGTSGTGARKNRRDKGSKGGSGRNVGSGKRADHHKGRILNKYGSDYFGKSGVTSRSTQKDKRDRINLRAIQGNPESFGKKASKGYEIELKGYKILGEGDVKDKLFITAKNASKLAVKKIEKAGGKVTLLDDKFKKNSVEKKKADSESNEDSE